MISVFISLGGIKLGMKWSLETRGTVPYATVGMALESRFFGNLNSCVIALSLIATAFAVSANADPVVYAIGNNAHFDTMDLATGAFTKIADTPPIVQYLANGPNSTLLTMAFIDSSIDTLDVSSGKLTFVGNSDANAGLVGGVAAVPEPASLTLLAVGFSQAVFFLALPRRGGRA